MIDPRTRMAAVAGSMALTMSLAVAPVAMAQDTPQDAIQGFMDAVVAKDFEALPGYFCEGEAAQAAEFDISALAGEMPEGIDVQSLLDAFIFEVSLNSMELISESETEAVVHVEGSMGMDLNAEALVPFVEAVIEMSGMEVDEATVEMFMGIVTSEFEAESEAIDAEVTLVPGESGWLICSDLDFSADASDDMSSDDSMDEDTSDDSMDDEAATEEDGE